MDLVKWWPWYEEIVRTFGFNPEEDQRATDVLSKLIADWAADPLDLRRIVEGRSVLIFGGGPSLERNIKELKEIDALDQFTIISADGATTALLRFADGRPDIVVTDLDGEMEDIYEAHGEGALVAIHGHGDNIGSLTKYVPGFGGRVIGTTQVKPRSAVYNFGGFTDGDRCAFLAEEMGAKRIVLAGMDLGVVVGRHSKPGLHEDVEADPTKRLKLEMAGRLLGWLSTWSRAEMVNVTGGETGIGGIRDITLHDIEEVGN